MPMDCDGFAGFGVPPVVPDYYDVDVDPHFGQPQHGQPPYQHYQQPPPPYYSQYAPVSHGSQPTVKQSITACHKVERRVPEEEWHDQVKWRPNYDDDDHDGIKWRLKHDDHDSVKRGKSERKRDENVTVIRPPPESTKSAHTTNTTLSHPLPIITAPTTAQPQANQKELEDCKKELQRLKKTDEEKEKERKKKKKGEEDETDTDTDDELGKPKKKKKPGRIKRFFSGLKKKKSRRKKEKEKGDEDNEDDDEAESSESGETGKKKKKGLSKGAKAGLAAAGVTTGVAAMAIPAIIAALSQKKNKSAGGEEGKKGGPLAIFGNLFKKKSKKGEPVVEVDESTQSDSLAEAQGLAEGEDEVVVVEVPKANQELINAQKNAFIPEPVPPAQSVASPPVTDTAPSSEAKPAEPVVEKPVEPVVTPVEPTAPVLTPPPVVTNPIIEAVPESLPVQTVPVPVPQPLPQPIQTPVINADNVTNPGTAITNPLQVPASVTDQSVPIVPNPTPTLPAPLLNPPDLRSLPAIQPPNPATVTVPTQRVTPGTVTNPQTPLSNPIVLDQLLNELTV